MHTLLNDINFTVGNDSLVSIHSPLSDHSSNIALILILSILCFFGVVFLIFGPVIQSEAMNHLDNYIFDQHENRDIEHCND